MTLVAQNYHYRPDEDLYRGQGQIAGRKINDYYTRSRLEGIMNFGGTWS